MGLKAEDYLVIPARGETFPTQGCYTGKTKKQFYRYATKRRWGCPAQSVAVSTQTRGQPACAAKYNFTNINSRLRLAPTIATWKES
jgi:hypothetical protein